MKVCSRCKVKKSDKSFSKNKKNKDGLAKWCKECTYNNPKELNNVKKQKKTNELNEEDKQILREFAESLPHSSVWVINEDVLRGWNREDVGFFSRVRNSIVNFFKKKRNHESQRT